MSSSTLDRPTAAEHGLHPVLAERRSTRAYDPEHVLDEGVLETLLEAARWAPSANNRQPWRFLVGLRGDATFARVLETLKPGNAVWAGDAAALVVGLAPVRDADGAPASHTSYELGLAVGQLTVQAHALGLTVHQMAGFEGEDLRSAFGVPAEYDALIVLAVGAPGDPGRLPETLQQRELAPRVREPLTTIAFRDAWGRPALVAPHREDAHAA